MSFDKVFGVKASQRDIFYEISPIIDKLISGYNCGVLAYGQTGSGKTYTMFGAPQKSKVNTVELELTDQTGLARRIIHSIFERKEAESNVYFSMYQIYNENVFDMLQVRIRHPKERKPFTGSEDR